jgi:hypothetical protein
MTHACWRSRFLQVDPVEGGSANDYDYVSGDPVNGLDLDGRCQDAGNPYCYSPGETGRSVNDRGTQGSSQRGRPNAFVKMVFYRGVAVGMRSAGIAAGGLCGPGVLVCAAVGGAVGGAAGGAYYYRMCGDGMVTCRHGRSDVGGTVSAAGFGMVGGSVRGAIPQTRAGYWIKRARGR